MAATRNTTDVRSVKPIAKILEQHFRSDTMPDKFYNALIDRMKRFDSVNRNWIVEWLDTYKGVQRDVEGGFDADYQVIKEYIRYWIVHMFDVKRQTAINKLDALLRHEVGSFDVDELERSNPSNYTNYSFFTVYGCPTSTDIDVAVFCPPTAKDNGSVVPLYTSEMVRLRSELTALGYDPNAEIDFNLMVVEDGVVKCSTKGGVETGNIVLATYMHHVQSRQSIELTGLVPVELNQEMYATKVASLAKFIWDYLKYCTEKTYYKMIHDHRSEVYQQDREKLMTELRDVIPKIIANPSNAESVGLDMVHWRSVFKTITMKLVQIIYFDLFGTMTYTKAEIANDSRRILEQIPSEHFTAESIESACQFFLFRGTSGVYHPELFQYLITAYFQIVDRLVSSSVKKTYVVNDLAARYRGLREDQIIEQIGVPFEIVESFLRSPKDATAEFEVLWTEFARGRTVNEVFIKKITENIEGVPPSILSVIRKKAIMIPQRTPEWIELLSFYTCGRNGAQISPDFQGQYNLIRGSLLEAICPFVCPVLTDVDKFLELVREWDQSITSLFDQRSDLQSNVRLFQLDVGFLVEEVGRRGARGAAPDLLLIVETSDGRSYMIPVEMKALKTGTECAVENADYRRGQSLAKRQIESVKQIVEPDRLSDIRSENSHLIPFGLTIMCWIHDGSLVMDVTPVRV